jgi:ribonuclease HII
MYSKSDLLTIGVDEAGRGTLFGNVVAAAVIMPDNLDDDF